MEIIIRGEIDLNMVETIANKIFKEYKAGEDVIADIDSRGGYIDSAEALAEMLRSLKDEGGSRLTAINSGDVMSAATLVWLECSERVWNTKGKFLIHLPYLTNASGTGEELLETSIEVLKVENTLAERYSVVSGLPVDEILEIMKQDRPLSLTELKELNFATSVNNNGI